ncbi:5'-Nucleotidase domain protein [Candidatus Vecturithrix granuli]|uniref:5'-Nucleotidase domain protein n=1 Tax=Vecturithrix granuli TaxID=1499967 RepID=A0A081C193_VECG1|nr:5'-Nucleotidase domain protein [Candidatus Vecturithrix granuli]
MYLEQGYVEDPAVLDFIQPYLDQPERSGMVHTSGLTWTVKKGIPEQVMVGNAPIELERVYKVVTTSYIAAGRPHYVAFENIPQYDTGFTDASMLREYIYETRHSRAQSRRTVEDY